MAVAVILFEGGESPDDTNIHIIPAWNHHELMALVCKTYACWEANESTDMFHGDTTPIRETLQPVAGMSNLMFTGVVDPEEGGQFYITHIPTHKDILSISDIVTMFQSINADAELAGESVVEFTDTEYYSNQIQNIFDFHWPVANAIARAMLAQVRPDL